MTIGIPMNKAMARATHLGRKTNTRRVMVPQPADVPKDVLTQCPYPLGATLYVREAFFLGKGYDELPAGKVNFAQTPSIKIAYVADGPKPDWAGRYRHGRFMPRCVARQWLTVTRVAVERVQDISEADAIAEGVERNCDGLEAHPDCPACRTVGKCQAEGEFLDYSGAEDSFPATSARDSYRTLWDSINEARGFSWESNPWVWSIHFQKTAAPEPDGQG